MNKYTVIFKGDVFDEIIFADRNYIDENWTSFYNNTEGMSVLDNKRCILRVATSEIRLIKTEFDVEK